MRKLPVENSVLLGTRQGSDIRRYPNEATPRTAFIGNMDIDSDGRGKNIPYDRFYQPDTTLHNHGLPLDTNQDEWMVVPGFLVSAVPGIVMGSRGRVTDLRTGKFRNVVVGDSGPSSKVGEVSRRVARMLGIDDDPNHGGVDSFDILYEFWEGVPADGYQLQPKGAR